MSNEYAKASENYQRYIYARDEGHLDWMHRAIMCDNYYNGDQWDEQTRAELDARGLPYLTFNKIQPTVDAMMGEYLRNRATIQYVASRDGTEEVAATLSKVFRHIAANNRLEHLERQVFQDGIITGRGYFDVRISFDDNIFGEVRIDSENPLNVLPDPDGDKMDPDTWGDVIRTKWLSEDDIVDTYAEEGDEQELRQRLRAISSASFDRFSGDVVHESYRGRFKPDDQVDGVATEVLGADGRLHRSYRVLERQYKRITRRDHFLDLRTGDIRLIPRNWDDERIFAVLQAHPDVTVVSRPHREIHWLVTVDSIVLFSERGFYKHFTLVPFFPDFRRGKTLSAVQHLISPQDMYNKVFSQELHVVNKTANSGWMFKAGSLIGMTKEDLESRGADTGVVIEWSGDAPPEKIEPNQIPSGLDRLSFKANQDIFQISGVGESMRGVDRADVSGKAIEEKRDAGGTSMGRVFEALAETRFILANRVLKLVQDFYTEPRTLRVSQDLFKPPEDVEVNQPAVDVPGMIHNDLTVGEYEVRLVPVPLRDSHDQIQFDEAMRLRVDAGIRIPDYRLVEYSHLEDKAEIAREVKQLAGGPLSQEAQERISEMEAQIKELELEEKRAVIRDKIEDAQLKAARSAKLRQEIEEGSLTVAKLDEMLLKARTQDAQLERKDRELDIRESSAAVNAAATAEKLAIERKKVQDAPNNSPSEDDSNA